jgi:hypothetical protein
VPRGGASLGGRAPPDDDGTAAAVAILSAHLGGVVIISVTA